MTARFLKKPLDTEYKLKTNEMHYFSMQYCAYIMIVQSFFKDNYSEDVLVKANML